MKILKMTKSERNEFKKKIYDVLNLIKNFTMTRSFYSVVGSV